MANPGWAELRVLDALTGRGVPLVELETVHGLPFVTDNAGRVAFQEPGLHGRPLFFSVTAHGYEVPTDGFGAAGVRLTPRVGVPAVVRLKRLTVAERLGRLTGEGLFRDSALLGYPVPPANPGRVAGQDSVQAVEYRGRTFWLWGDTSRLEHPLGLFRMAGATTPLPPADPAGGVRYNYFTDPSTGFARAMMPLAERPEGVVWVFAPCVVPDAAGRDRLAAYYTRRKGLEGEYEQGIALWDDARQVFEPARQLPPAERWRKPGGHPVVVEEGGARWLLFNSPTPNVRVPANLQAVLDPTKYEAFTPAEADGKPADPPAWRWQRDLPPADSKREAAWVKAGVLKPEHARFLPADAGKPADRVTLHSGSVRWNAFRRRWVLVAGQIGGTSHLGEVWYSEADHPTGPFRRAVKVATHDRQTFYNVCHHAFWDRDGGRLIHFEGTFTRDFSGNPRRVPRYEYNQLLYRLDLGDARLAGARD